MIFGDSEKLKVDWALLRNLNIYKVFSEKISKILDMIFLLNNLKPVGATKKVNVAKSSQKD